MGTLPILLKNPQILLIGGGKVALHKALILKKNNIDFSIIATRICPELAAFKVLQQEKTLELTDLNQVKIIVDATGNSSVAELIKQKKKTTNILFNCVDQPELCDFFFSSLSIHGDLKIAVSTNGCSPSIGQIVRDKIEAIIPAEIIPLLEKTGNERKLGNINTATVKDACNALFANSMKK